MKKSPKKKRPAVLVRFYGTDLARLSRHCATQCTPRENYIRRAVLDRMADDDARSGVTPPPVAPSGIKTFLDPERNKVRKSR